MAGAHDDGVATSSLSMLPTRVLCMAGMVLPPAQHHTLSHLPTLTIDRRSLPTCLL